MPTGSVSKSHTLDRYPAYNAGAVGRRLAEAIKTLDHKIIVLDDDPTGVQTVRGVYVHTDWTLQSIEEGFRAPGSMFFILTNSRALDEVSTIRVHEELARNIAAASKRTGKDFLIISRSDSTLRGHYPLETEILRRVLAREAGIKMDGEILLPFFLEGGRLTVDDIHYVADGDRLTPVAETEFARDKTFGYKNSNLRLWIEEKTGGRYRANETVSITLEELRALDYARVEEKLLSVTDFHKVIVNAIAYEDVEVFATALIGALHKNKRFLFRSAAALARVLGGIVDNPLLTGGEVAGQGNCNAGLIVAGSHVARTTQQLEALKSSGLACFIEFNQHLVLDDERFERERRRVVAEAERLITSGKTVVVSTRRERFDLADGGPEDQLHLAMKISGAITSIVQDLSASPGFLVAKGGITSSEIGVHALGVKRALVLGQILPGVPVWLLDSQSRFPGMPYIIFPGNVGDENALKDVVTIMKQER